MESSFTLILTKEKSHVDICFIMVKKVNWVGTLFSASRNAYLLFSSGWARLLNLNKMLL